MYPFEIRVHALERMLIDKVFTICDYMERNIILRQLRHLYDISRLLTKVKLDENLKEFAREVKEDRKSNKTCVSAQYGVNVPELLHKGIDTHFFKKDYEDNTLKLLSKPVGYDETIKAIEKIFEGGIFVSDDGMCSGNKKDLKA